MLPVVGFINTVVVYCCQAARPLMGEAADFHKGSKMETGSKAQRAIISFSDPNEKLDFDGERYVSGHLGPTQHAHHHRYLIARQHCQGKDVLDLASGEGYGSDLLAQVANTVIGVDIDKAAVEFANRQYVRPGLRYINAPATALPLKNDSIDVVVSFETIEHLVDHATFMNEIQRVLRPDGLLIISSPNRPIYSDKPDYHNPFHFKELDLPEFRSLLEGSFENVRMFAQRQVTGSVLSPEELTGLPDEVYATENAQSYSHELLFDAPQYFVAFASNATVSVHPGSILVNEVFVSNLQKQATYHRGQLFSEREKSANLDERLRKTQSNAVDLNEDLTAAKIEKNEAIQKLKAIERKNIEMLERIKFAEDKLNSSFPIQLGRYFKNSGYFIRLTLLFVRSFASSPSSRRGRLHYIQRHIARKSEGFERFTGAQLRASAHAKWKFKAVMRYPTSSTRRKQWRMDNPFFYTPGPRPDLSNGIETASTPNQPGARFLSKMQWKLKAFWRYPTSSSRRKTWRTDHPFIDAQTLLPYQSNTSTDRWDGGKKGGNGDQSNSGSQAIHARLYEKWVSNALGEYPIDEHVEITRNKPLANISDVQLIAYYLPQFHPIPENDEWWGKGFTEWRNVARAFPNFEGHYQPRIPGELGYYDLRVPQVMKRQVELAQLYGISAFCFHFYWFAGKTLLETPVSTYLENTDLSLPFCLCWANENWSRRWDGSEHEVLMAQQHSPEDDEAFLHHVRKYFADPRYLKIDGRPVLTVYRPSILPDPRATVERWRRLAKEWGYPDLYLIATNSFGFKDYEKLGFDALSEFPPHHIAADNVQFKLEMTSLRTGWRVRNYESVVHSEKARDPGIGRIHPGITMGWDNSARKPAWGDVLHGASPALFHEWLAHCVLRAKSNPADEQLVFVNAWNEWAEGTYLEPDKRFGYAFLDVCAQTLKEDVYGKLGNHQIVTGARVRSSDKKTVLVCSHHAGKELFGAERSMLDVMQAMVSNGYNVVVTLPGSVSEEYLERLLEWSVEVRIFPYKQWSVESGVTLSSVPSFMATIRDVGADLVYANTIVLRAPVEAARYSGVPSIIHAREIIAADVNLQEQIGMAGSEIAKVVARSCTHIVANSAATAASFDSDAALSKIPNIADVQDLDIPNEAVGEIVRFGIISSNLPKKGIDDVVELARKCLDEAPSARFVVIGPFWRPGVKGYIDGSLAAPANVEFIDYIPSTKDAVSQINVILNFSHFQESFGRTVLEAMAAGRPAIVYDWGALPELVEDGVSGFIVPFRDLGAAVNAVRSLTNIGLFREMGSAARHRALLLSDRNAFNQSIASALERVWATGTPNGESGSNPATDVSVDIVVCIHNALEDVKACLASVDRYLGKSHRLFLVDDGSDAETQNLLKLFGDGRPYVTLHRNPTALGYTKAANIGVRLTNADIVILLNSDTVVTRNWAEKIADLLVRNSHIGIAGPMSNAASYQSLPAVESTSNQTALNGMPFGWGPEEMNDFCESEFSLPFPSVPLVHGFCFAMKRDTWNILGPFDEAAFPRGFGEENDFCLRATSAGIGMALATNTFVYHAKSKSYGTGTRHELAEKAQEILYARHGKDRFMDAVRILRNDAQLRRLRAAAALVTFKNSTNVD